MLKVTWAFSKLKTTSTFRSNLSQVRFNLWLVTALCVSGLLLCVYHGTFFRLLPIQSNLIPWPVDERERTCRLDTNRCDWFVFLALVTVDVYCGPNLISLALALALLLRTRAAQLSRTRLFVNSVSCCISSRNTDQIWIYFILDPWQSDF